MVARADFRENLAWGSEAERAVAALAMRGGCFVLPVYDFSGLANDKAPKLTCGAGRTPLVMPDLLVSRAGRSWLLEVKRKTSADLYRKLRRLETGIDRRQWDHYRQVEIETGIPVWLVFVHDRQREVIWARIADLVGVARFAPEFGKGGMMFFPCDAFKRLASFDELFAARSEQR